MKSYYSIALFTLFAIVMAVFGVIQAATHHADLSPADAAVVALAVIAGMLAYRLSQAEKRIAHLENRIEKKTAECKTQADRADAPVTDEKQRASDTTKPSGE